jgi:hypothetical protein
MNSFAIAFDYSGTRPVAAEQPGFFSGFQYVEHGNYRADTREVTDERIDIAIRNPDRFARLKSRRYMFVKRFCDGVLKVIASGRQGHLAQIVTVYYLNPNQIRELGL